MQNKKIDYGLDRVIECSEETDLQCTSRRHWEVLFLGEISKHTTRLSLPGPMVKSSYPCVPKSVLQGLLLILTKTPTDVGLQISLKHCFL